MAETVHSSFIRAVGDGVPRDQLLRVFAISDRTATRWMTTPPGRRGRRSRVCQVTLRRCVALARARRQCPHTGRLIPEFPSARLIAERLTADGIPISRWTVRRMLLSVGFRSRVRPRHPNLHAPGRRYAFTRIWRRRSTDNLVFSDEHFISTNDHSARQMIVGPGEQPLPREFQRRQNVPNFQIWAAIGINWRSKLVFFPKRSQNANRDEEGGFRLNAPAYVKRCLSTIVGDVKGKIFMHDGARAHSAASVKAYLDRKGVDLMPNFPAASPDLNPIECVWAELNRRIADLQPHDDASLRTAAIRAWSEIPEANINAHVRRFRENCERVYQNGGV